MSSLELRIPPPAVTAIVAFIMWGINVVTPSLQFHDTTRVVAAISVALLGGCISLVGVISFRRMKTTINPTRPEKASLLVASGVFKVTRNPMYVGMVLVLFGWAIFLSSPWALLGPIAFTLYITRFQIIPEERALDAIFGSEYTSYKARVRRWI
ncbi:MULTISPECIES: methyltransferase family protein [Marinobacter]|uniref:methyltransferase family protein n=1 Tax=Marinobacter TaxID=2742 RepID=UPI002811F2AD|nr:isoprenylcysteine carboxylmethyltransferase family protein [Marinobacter sp. F26243]